MAALVPEQEWLDRLVLLEDEGAISGEQELDLENVLSVLGNDQGELNEIANSAMESALRAALNNYKEA